MIDTKTLVDDLLLKQLASETKKIGSHVRVKSSATHPEFMADILDVIILPHAEFYRSKYMNYYKLCNYNAVKALKELNRHFPFIPDFELGIAYVLNLEVTEETISNAIKTVKELEFLTQVGANAELIQTQNIQITKQ